MTLMGFLKFISQSPGHFIGFIIVVGLLGDFILELAQTIFNNRNKNDN